MEVDHSFRYGVCSCFNAATEKSCLVKLFLELVTQRGQSAARELVQLVKIVEQEILLPTKKSFTVKNLLL